MLLQTPSDAMIYCYKFNDMEMLSTATYYTEEVDAEEVAEELVIKYYPLTENSFTYNNMQGFPSSRVGTANILVYMKKQDEENFAKYNVLVVRKDYTSAEKL